MINVSIVVPVYNVEKYLEECINSILSQTYSALDIILVDDGSTDTSGAICDRYALQDERIRVIHQENKGLSAARNAGLSISTGEYVYFLDSDDYVSADCIEKLLDTAVYANAEVVFFDAKSFFTDCDENIDEATKYIRKSRYKTGKGREQLLQLLRNEEYRTCVPLLFFKKEYLITNGLNFMEGIIHEDELFTYLVFHKDGNIAHCHEQLYARRVRPGSIMTASAYTKRFDSMLKIYWELTSYYDKELHKDTASTIYMVRTAKNVIDKYNRMKDTNIVTQKAYTAFRQNVMKHHGYGDHKLRIKCANTFIGKYYQRLSYHLWIKTRNY